MKSLEPKGYAVTPYLSKKESELVAAAYSPKLSSLAETAGIKQIVNIVNRAYLEMEKAPAGLNAFERKRYLDVFAKLILADLALYFQQVTIKEVEVAVRNGIRREYGDFYNLSVVAIHMFVEKFLASEDRAIALQKHEQQKARNEDVPPDEATIWSIINTGIRTCYADYLKSSRLIDYGNSTYDYLLKAGLINLTMEEKHEIYELAIIELARETQTRSSISYHAWQLQKNAGVGNDIDAKCKSKEIALRRYFDKRPDIEVIIERVHKTYK